MKDMSKVLSHLKINPTFNKLNTQSELDKLVSVLPVQLKNGVDFYYIKNRILFFALIHQGYMFEFKNKDNQNLIKTLLKQLKLNESIDDLKFFVTNKAVIKKTQDSRNKIIRPLYERKSWGIFDNKANDPKIHEKFENIRSLIKKKIK